MNCILNKHFEANRKLFCQRFPELSEALGFSSSEAAQHLIESLPSSIALKTTKSDHPTISISGMYLHSKIDPIREAHRIYDRIITESSVDTGCVFYGCALGWLPEYYCEQRPNTTIILIEPNVYMLLLLLASRPLDSFLGHQKLIIISKNTPLNAYTVLEKLNALEYQIVSPPSLLTSDPQWFKEFFSIQTRQKEKKNINANTLRRFGNLWLKNMGKNLRQMRDCDGIEQYTNLFPDIPVLILAGGPSLDSLLPLLPELAKRMCIVCVDTALRACLRTGVEPDFIILVDPQYWNWRHLDGLQSPKSILITEAATWPAVFSFQCAKISICSSLFPLGQFIEEHTHKKGILGAGGSVSTTAWDFARVMGAKKILFAGLDLGYPNKRTHFSGSIFEERSHSVSTRLETAETAGFRALYAALPYPVPNYNGDTVLTDKRLHLYAWWFEAKLAQYPNQVTETFSGEGTKIEGITVCKLNQYLALPNKRDEIHARCEKVVDSRNNVTPELFYQAVSLLIKELSDISSLAEQAKKLSTKAYQKTTLSVKEENQLSQLDEKILNHPVKNIVSMVFSTTSETTEPNALKKSIEVYCSILLAAKKNKDTLEKYIKDLY